jgi:potassium voltage-gated channel Eag-related subfamily H protein 8
MERMVNDRLAWFLETNGILTEYQSGFRKNRSTIDQIIRLESAVRETFIKQEHMMPLFKSKLRQFAVKIGTIISNFYDQEEGVPEGTILSVTLFSVKINGIVKSLSPGIDCSLYVDDFVIYYKSKHTHTINRQPTPTMFI